MQGYLYSKPVPAAQFEALLVSSAFSAPCGMLPMAACVTAGKTHQLIRFGR
jgi:hypothetical protein